MAINDSYATVTEYLAAFGREDTSATPEILADLTAISRMIEGRLGRFFTSDSVATTRIVPTTRDSVSGLTLYVPELAATPTSVKIADAVGSSTFSGPSLVLGTDYDLGPASALWGPEPQPYTQLILRTSSAYRWTVGQNVQVVARFGWPAVPTAVKRACIELTALKRLETPRATRRIAEMGETQEVTMDAQNIIMKLLDTYRIHYFA